MREWMLKFARRQMTKASRQRPTRLLALLLLLSGMAFHAHACGPFFPNWLLAEGDTAVLRAPEAYFRVEIQRMRLVTTTNVARVADNPERDTMEMDLADLRKALQATGMPAAQIESCLARHQAERLKLRDSSETQAVTDTNSPPVVVSSPQVTPGLPPEFADYFRGAIAWHQTNLLAARAAWLGLLKRPPAERHYKSAWAAFMLAKSWETEDPDQAIALYRRVRELAKSGFADSLGLAVESLGWGARLEWQQKHYVAAIDLYLEQGAAGDPTAENSLRFVAADALRHGRSALGSLARSPRAQRVITAYVISGGYRQPDVDVDGVVKETGMLLWSKASAKVSVIPAPNTAWHNLRPLARLWLEAVESAKVRDVESAEQLALAAYQAGEMETARRWLDRAKPTLAAKWLRAKLALRDGKVDAAAELLANVANTVTVRALPTNAASIRELADNLYVHTGLVDDSPNLASLGQSVQGELAVFKLARQHYLETLDSLMHSSPAYWMDGAYVAERLLSLEELKSYVDRKFPEAPVANPEASAKNANVATQNQPDESPQLEHNGSEAVNYRPEYNNRYLPGRSEYTGADGIRYLLARRLARAYRFDEARAYYPPEWLPLFDQLNAAWRTAENTGNPQMERGQALLEAAVLTRKYGLELIGTEVEPDWRIHRGDFEEGVSVTGRASLRGSNFLAASSEELRLAASRDVRPEQRWHYRTVAAVIGWEAAKLLRGGGTPGQAPAERARMLFAAATTLQEHGISSGPFDIQPTSNPHQAEAARAATLTDRVNQSLSRFATKTDADNGRAISSTNLTAEGLWEGGFTSAALAWDAAQLLPNNSDETARILCLGGSWISLDPPAADILYKALVRRCRKTAIGAEADRLRWFPKLDKQGNLVPRKTERTPPAKAEGT